jgi:DNA-binding IscR family transcriptional regulator
MEKGGLVSIARGKDGGAELVADLKTVSLYDLLAIINEKRYVSACMQPGYECAWRKAHHSTCSIHSHLSEIQASLDKELQKKSLYHILFEG